MPGKQQATISVVGVSHHTAPVEARERFALPEDSASRFLRTLHTQTVFEEALVLDTCNRTEVYFVASPDRDAVEYLRGLVAQIRGVEPVEDPDAFYRYDGEDAVRHLFRVAAGLDSQVLGEHQILGQVKSAYRTALEQRTAGFFLNRLMHAAFRAGKRVQTETALGSGSASVCQAAVDLAVETLGDLAGRTALLVGAGKNAELTARALIREGVSRVLVANRSVDRAEALAVRLGEVRPAPGATASSPATRHAPAEDAPVQAPRCPVLLRRVGGAADQVSPPELARVETRPVALADLPAALDEADVTICSTGAESFVLRREDLDGRLDRSDRPLCVVDIAMPRDADPALEELPGVHLWDLDDLDRIIARSAELRRRETPRAERIIDEEITRFSDWLESLQITPTIKLLKRRFALLRREQIDRYAAQFNGAAGQLDPFTRTLCNRILHHPIDYLRRVVRDGSLSDRLAAVDMIRRMFDLDAVERDE